MRPNYTDLPAAQWTFEEGLHHLTQTFDRAARQWPDLLEPYMVRLIDADDHERKRIMQTGLRETFAARYGT